MAAKENTAEVIVVGAGFAGLGAAIRLQQAGYQSILILEQAAEVGGTWRDNIYPGCACDVPSHLYSFSFAPNPHWSQMYSTQPEIWRYMKDCVQRFNLSPYLRLNTHIIHYTFKEQTGTWQLRAENGEVFEARVVVSATGPLNRPNIPRLRGIEQFAGEAFHSMYWNYDLDLHDKRVAVIGTGASAIQFVPEIAPYVQHLTLFQRTAPWVLPKYDRPIGKSEQKVFANLPFLQKGYRELIYWINEFRGLSFIGNETLARLGQKVALKHIADSIPDLDLRRKATPNYKMGCKRVLISNDYYPALCRDNVSLITEGIAEVVPEGLIDATGQLHKADVIIYGTGFVAADFHDTLHITGRGGRNLIDEWSIKGAEAYYGTTVSGFPNLLFIVGPNTGLGHNSIIHMIESQLNYLLDYLRFLRQMGDNQYLDLKPEVQVRFNDEIQSRLQGTVWTSGCQSWYQNERGKNTTLWPGLNTEYRRRTAKVRLTDYDLVKVN